MCSPATIHGNVNCLPIISKALFVSMGGQPDSNLMADIVHVLIGTLCTSQLFQQRSIIRGVGAWHTCREPVTISMIC